MLAGALLTESRYWWKLLKQIRQEMAAVRPDVVVPIDSSFINLRIAAAAKKQGFPVCYYVAPQVWASRPWRVRKIRKCVDTLCCMFPFEEKYFQLRGVHAVYVGHPMFDAPPRSGDVTPPLPAGGPKVALFPGSRKAEIGKHMAPMLAVSAEIRRQFPGAAFVAVAPSDGPTWSSPRAALPRCRSQGRGSPWWSCLPCQAGSGPWPSR
jgi:lipid-A-disaccharide synthase